MYNKITYAGKVTLKVKSKPPIKRLNSGTPILFNTLCNILINGTASLNDMLPVSFGLLLGDNITAEDLSSNPTFSLYENSSLIVDELHILDRQVRKGTSVYFSSTLWPSQVHAAHKNLDDTTDCYIVMLNNKDEILAHANFMFKDIKTVWSDATSQCIIEWEMFFANAIKEDA